MNEPLTPEVRLRLEALFDRAAELPPAQHAAFVERECGSDLALRAALAGLLSGLVGDDLLDQIRPGVPTRAGTRIGPYELLEKIGEGGMGEVYCAEQRSPVARRVALKIIKPGMDSTAVIARFEAERQALARMTHPNIAQVYDAGTTESGSPYFVMEYIAGEPITEYCDRRKLSTSARLELFLEVCEGVQHAHQKGIIHRDLKPSNLLVTERDGRAMPKIIDFGVARATVGRLAERTLHTMLGQIVGTLDYMSPEQADPTAVDVDTRSDIYSLGVVLYHLLSGLLPFEHASAPDVPFSEVQRAIRENDPPTPSTRLRRKSGTATVLAPLRGTNERGLIRQLSGDLDWICLKALEKDPARRYGAATELAADVRRHLAHEPVLAGRPGVLYRAKKFARRNRVGVAGGAVLAAGVAAGSFGMYSGRLEAQASERVADALLPQADAYRLRQLEQEAQGLWPPHPNLIPAMKAWMATANELVLRLEAHALELAELQERARPWTGAMRERDRTAHPRFEELTSMQAELAGWIQNLDDGVLPDHIVEESEGRVPWLKSEIAALEPEVARQRTWSFESEKDAASHEGLHRLVEGLSGLRDELQGGRTIRPGFGWSVAKRLQFARELEAGFAGGGTFDRTWEAALPRIQQTYPGLDLKPQMGLLPLGPDPDSDLEEFAHLQSGEPAQRGADRKLTSRDGTGLVLVLIPEGTFWMGAQWQDASQPNYDVALSSYMERVLAQAKRENPFVPNPQVLQQLTSFERPLVEITVPAFFLSKFEMTQAQWMRCLGVNPSLYQQGIVKQEPRNPVNQVTWNECTLATRMLGVALPSEKQWEYAARAGAGSVWWTGNDSIDVRRAANLRGRKGEDAFRAITAVGSLAANPFGLHDVIGNVSEWCENHPYRYGTTPGTGPETLRMYVTRGGSSRDSWILARTSARAPVRSGADSPVLGLRPAKPIDID